MRQLPEPVVRSIVSLPANHMRGCAMARTLISISAAFAAAFATSAAADENVPAYHGSAGRGGNFVVPALTWDRAAKLHADSAFRAEFPGHVYAQPLYWRGNLIVATEDNTVEALDGKTGRMVWRRALGRPVARSELSCGNIDPLGITGTPVIGEASGTLYVDANVSTGNGPRHQVFALALKDGSVVPGWPVDVTKALQQKQQDFVSREQNERGALAILGGRVYVPFGGHFGDCGQYRGWVVGISLNNPKDLVSWATRARGGGIWAPGGIANDGSSLYVATGNTFGASNWSDGEAVIRLSPNLPAPTGSRDYFAPTDWQSLDRSDLDLGGANPLLLDFAGGRHYVLALGKDARAYLLDRDNLGGIGGALAVETVANGAIRTAPAAYPGPDGMFVAFQGAGTQCPSRGASGLTVLKVVAGTKPSVSTAWCADPKGRGSPMVTTTDGHSNPVVWIAGAEGDSRLHGFRGDNGAPLFAGGSPAEAMTGLHHFQTLIAAGDRLYVAADGRAYAFAY
jgi:putative pyrroloquinoline-quinone binding quinoprotein